MSPTTQPTAPASDGLRLTMADTPAPGVRTAADGTGHVVPAAEPSADTPPARD